MEEIEEREEDIEEEKEDESAEILDKNYIESLFRKNVDPVLDLSMKGLTTDDMKTIGDVLRSDKVRE